MIYNSTKYNDNKLKGTPIYIGVSIALVIMLILSIGISVSMGSVDIPIKDVYKIIIDKILRNSDEIGPIHDVVWLIRLPRIILAIAVGMGLSVVGIVMQAIVKNPLADPYILGVSSGASLGATLAVVLGIGTTLGNNAIGIVGFIGAFLISILVLLIANIGGRPNSVKLIIVGMGLSSICSAYSSFLIYMADNAQATKNITFWLMGSLVGAKWDQINFILPIVLIGTIFFISQSRVLNLMLLGDDVAITLGIDLNKYRNIYLIITSLMIGVLVYACGTIGFVGLIIPHVVRVIFGTNHKRVILISALLGAIFLIWSDVLSRTIIKGVEIPIGILISMIGAPCFIYLMIKKTYGFGGNS